MTNKDSGINTNKNTNQSVNLPFETVEQFRYEDIINLSPPVFETHMPMPLIDRAAQFAPFAALSGYSSVIAETSRLTDNMPLLSEEKKLEIGSRLAFLRSIIHMSPKVEVSYFVPDKLKRGGESKTVTDTVQKTDEIKQLLILQSGCEIDFCRILSINGDVFD